MGRFRVVLFVLEFWEVLLAFVPVVLAGIWFGFRDYFAAQNAFLLEYKPTIDSVALVVAIGSLVIGYVNLMHELKTLNSQPPPTPQAQTGKQVAMISKATGYIYMRKCPQPNNHSCPAIAKLAPRTPVLALPFVSYYTDSQTGNRLRWRKISTGGYEGWVNESLLWPSNANTQ